jgi:hypothetical protein
MARTEVVRSWRRLEADPALLVSLALMVLSLAGGGAAVAAVLSVGDPALPVDRGVAAGAVATGLWLAVAFVFASRSLSITGRPDGAPAVVLAVDVPTGVAGTLLAEWVRALAVFGPATLAAAVTLGALTGRPVTLVTVTVAGALALAGAVAVGYAAGLAAKVTVGAARSRGVHWSAVAGAFAVPVVGVAAVGGDLLSTPETLLAAVAGLPPGRLADLGLVSLGAAPASAVGAALGSVAVTGVAGALAVVLSERVWFADGDDRQAVAVHPGGLGGTAVPGVDDRAAAVCRVVWLRAWRAPVKLVYVLYPVGGVLAILLDPTTTRVAAVLFGYVPTYAAWAGGAGLALNPFGDQGVGAAATALSTAPGAVLARGYLLAAAVPGTALGAVAVLGFGLAAALPVESVLVGLAGATAVSVTAGAVAVAVGTRFPGYDGVDVSGTTVVKPSFAASSLYFLVLSVLSAPGLYALLAVAGVGPLPATPTVLGACVLAQVGIATLAVRGADRLAGRAFDRYRP